jgi:hypothetical protein
VKSRFSLLDDCDVTHNGLGIGGWLARRGDGQNGLFLQEPLPVQLFGQVGDVKSIEPFCAFLFRGRAPGRAAKPTN